MIKRLDETIHPYPFLSIKQHARQHVLVAVLPCETSDELLFKSNVIASSTFFLKSYHNVKRSKLNNRTFSKSSGGQFVIAVTIFVSLLSSLSLLLLLLLLLFTVAMVRTSAADGEIVRLASSVHRRGGHSNAA